MNAHPRHGLLSVLAALCLLLCFCASPARTAYAAGLAEEHTVLYYLVEVQRRHTKKCGGEVTPDAASLKPSEKLQELAATALENNYPPDELARVWGLAGTAFFSANVHGKNAQQAFNALIARQCQAIMKPEYRYIGAAMANGQWVVFLAANEPKRPDPSAEAKHEPEHSGATAKTEKKSGRSPLVGDPSAAKPVIVGEMDISHSGAPSFELRPVVSPQAPAHEATGDLHGEVSVTKPVVREGGRGPSAPPLPSTQAGGDASVVPLEDTRPKPARPSTEEGTAFGIFAGEGAGATGEAGAGNAQARELLRLANAARGMARTCGAKNAPAVPALLESAKLAAAAQAQAADMQARGYVSPKTPEGLTFGDRAASFGYTFSEMAGNVAARAITPENALSGWLANENQCLNIMNPAFTEAGVGFAGSGNNWVLILAAPPGNAQ